jgi:mannose-6-phosphate isomerase
MERLIFSRFFAAERITWVNQLDGSGAVLSSDALSRLIYHVLLFVTEGVRAGLWNLQRNHSQ